MEEIRKFHVLTVEVSLRVKQFIRAGEKRDAFTFRSSQHRYTSISQLEFKNHLWQTRITSS